jgi:hypothetical protein
MFFRTRLRSEIHAAFQKGEDYLTFDACLKAVVKAETALCLDVEYNKAFKSVPKDRAQEKARNGRENACNIQLESRLTQDVL